MVWKRKTFWGSQRKKKQGGKGRKGGSKKGATSQLEDRFLKVFLELFPHLPKPTRQHRFHPKRLFRFDFAWVEYKVAVEIQGGGFIRRGGHNTAIGQSQDYEKFREAVLRDWKLFIFGTHDLQENRVMRKRRGHGKTKMLRKFTIYDCVIFVGEFLEKQGA